MEPSRDDIDSLSGPLVIEFGAAWCGICAAAQPLIRQALAERADARHLKIEDGPGKRLGRSFGIKLWPTLVVLHDGREVARVVRPRAIEELRDALSLLPG